MDDETAAITAQRQAIGRAIHDARRAARISQERLAIRCGLDRRTIQRVEGGQTDARLTWLLAIAHHLGTTLADLARPGRG